MALSPKLLDEKFMSEVDFYEKEIDKKLATNSLIFKINAYVTLNIPSGMTINHFDILKQRYLNVGWKFVNWESDQREGEWLLFRG